jgi:hypothetical protein
MDEAFGSGPRLHDELAAYSDAVKKGPEESFWTKTLEATVSQWLLNAKRRMTSSNTKLGRPTPPSD